ncbi:MAG: hypothetical protein ACTSUR_07850 [Candidatus Heimdallarchaeaceae archaeon]
MRDSLELLLERIENSKKFKFKEKIDFSSIILRFGDENSDEEKLKKRILEIRKYVSEIIVSVPKGWKTRIFNDEIDENYSGKKYLENVKFIEREKGSSSLDCCAFYQLLKKCVNDRILVLPFDLPISLTKMQYIIEQKASFVTYLSSNGFILPTFFTLNKWFHRFLCQIALLNPESNINDLFRLTSEIVFLKLMKDDSLIDRKEVLDQQFNSYKTRFKHYFHLEFSHHVATQDLVKAIALIQGMKIKMNDNEVITSTFKIQQLLLLQEKFAKQENYYLAFQILFFLLQNRKKIKKLPLKWTYQDLEAQCRKLLLEESKFYAQNKIEGLRYLTLLDLRKYNFIRASEESWIMDEIKKIQESLQKDLFF